MVAPEKPGDQSPAAPAPPQGGFQKNVRRASRVSLPARSKGGTHGSGGPKRHSSRISSDSAKDYNEKAKDWSKKITHRWSTQLQRKSQKIMTDLQAENEEVSFDDVVTARRAAEEENQKKQLRFLLVPGSTSLALWHSLTILLVLAAVIISPMDMAFSYDPFFESITWMSKMLDVFFISDMVLKFFVATTAHGRLETNHQRLAIGYLKGWFFPDLLINFPWDLVFSEGSGKGRKLAKVLKLPKVLRVTRLLRVAGDEAHYFGTMANIGGILLMAHYSSCLFAMALIDCGEEDAGCPDVMTVYLQGLSVGMASVAGSDGWVRFFPVAASEAFGMDSTGSADVVEYSAAAKWNNEVEGEMIAAMTNLAGFCLIGILFSNISHAMDQQNHHTRLFQSRLETLQAARQQHPIPDELYHRVKRHYYYVWSCGSDTANAMLGDVTLSVDLRRQLAYTFYGHLLLQVPFLETADQAFIRHICEFVEMEILAAGDRVASAGEVATELYFVAVGKVQMVLPAEGDADGDEGTVIKVLDEGSFFGELGLLFPESQHKVNLVAVLPGWLLVIDRSTIESICSEELLETFRSVAVERLRETETQLGSDYVAKTSAAEEDIDSRKDSSGIGEGDASRAKSSELKSADGSDGNCASEEEKDNFDSQQLDILKPVNVDPTLLPATALSARGSIVSNASGKPAWVSSRRRKNFTDTAHSRRQSMQPQSLTAPSVLPLTSQLLKENGQLSRRQSLASMASSSLGPASEEGGRRLSSMSYISLGGASVGNMASSASSVCDFDQTGAQPVQIPQLLEFFSSKVDHGLDRLSSLAVALNRQMTSLEARILDKKTLQPQLSLKGVAKVEPQADLPWSVPEPDG